MARLWLFALLWFVFFAGAGCRSTEKQPREDILNQEYNPQERKKQGLPPLRYDGGEQPSLLDSLIRPQSRD